MPTKKDLARRLEQVDNVISGNVPWSLSRPRGHANFLLHHRDDLMKLGHAYHDLSWRYKTLVDMERQILQNTSRPARKNKLLQRINNSWYK